MQINSTVSTNVQLVLLMKSIVASVIQEVSDNLLKVFKREYILKIAYRGYTNYSGNSVYRNPEEDMTFKESWEWEAIKQSSTEVTRKMWQNWRIMNKDPHAFGTNIGIHSSIVKGWLPDERPYLAETLNKSAPSSSLGMSVSRPGAYWDDFIRDYVTSGKLKKDFDKAFLKHGITSG